MCTRATYTVALGHVLCHRQAETPPCYDGSYIYRLLEKALVHLISRQTASMNSTMNIVSWAAEPEGRGTVGLLWSCFATVFLSTWNALHPNLPGLRESNCAILRRRVAYVMGCLVAPEIYAFSALAEVVSATRLKARVSWSHLKAFHGVELVVDSWLVTEKMLLSTNGRIRCPGWIPS
jgi:hypothetical protein